MNVFTRAAGFCLLSLPGLLAGVASASDLFGDAKPIVLNNGFNHVTLAGHAVTIVQAARANGNAHSFVVTTLYTEGPEEGDATKTSLNIVPAFSNDPRETYERHNLITGGGADCVLDDFRILVSRHDSLVYLLRAERENHLTFVDAEPVHFDIYRLHDERGQPIGRPPLYFEFDRRIDASKNYCDVDVAMREELGVP